MGKEEKYVTGGESSQRWAKHQEKQVSIPSLETREKELGHFTPKLREYLGYRDTSQITPGQECSGKSPKGGPGAETKRRRGPLETMESRLSWPARGFPKESPGRVGGLTRNGGEGPVGRGKSLRAISKKKVYSPLYDRAYTTLVG